MKRPCLLLLWLMCAGLSGCSLSGYQGNSRYACAAPEGVACDSISGVYANAVRQRLPNQVSVTSKDATLERVVLAASPATDSVSPLRSPTRILRLWIKPWEDRDGDLHDQSFVYVRVDDGRWLIEHVQQQRRDAYAPVRPPATETVTEPAQPLPAPSLPLPFTLPEVPEDQP